jgi:hypothetical protein
MKRYYKLVLLLVLVCVALMTITRQFRDPPQSTESSQSSAVNSICLMLASHGRLMWYCPETDSTVVLDEGGVSLIIVTGILSFNDGDGNVFAGQGVHYGTFPGKRSEKGDLTTVWTVVRPHNWHPNTTEEVLLELDVVTGIKLQCC